MLKIIGIILAVFILGYAYFRGIQLEQNCTGYLKRAADASSIEMAKSQLDIAIKFLEENDITSGYTSVFYRTPDEDIGYWYSNLKSSQKDLNDSTQFNSVDGKKLMLLKLRQTLLDNGKDGDKVTYPKGLAFYPMNAGWGFSRLFAIGILLAIFIHYKFGKRR